MIKSRTVVQEKIFINVSGWKRFIMFEKVTFSYKKVEKNNNI